MEYSIASTPPHQWALTRVEQAAGRKKSAKTEVWHLSFSIYFLLWVPTKAFKKRATNHTNIWSLACVLMLSPSLQYIKRRHSEVLAWKSLFIFHEQNAYPERHPSHGAYGVKDKSTPGWQEGVTLAIPYLTLGERQGRERGRWPNLTGKQKKWCH